MKLGERIRAPLVMLAAGLFLSLAVSMRAQVQTSTTTTEGAAATKDVTVEKGTVVSVNGNDLVVKMDNGEIRHFPNVPESARITVDGQQMGIHDLKPGMTLQRTITTTTTPKIITTTQTVTGKVWNVMPPNSVILTLENGTNQQFKIPKGQKFNVDGQMVDAFSLRNGMTITATKVTEVPETELNVKKITTGQLPPPPPPAADAPILVAVEVPAEAAPAEAAPAKLPKTGSGLPLIGLAGALMVLLGLALRAWRFSL